jgi:hypothetical protein
VEDGVNVDPSGHSRVVLGTILALKFSTKIEPKMTKKSAKKSAKKTEEKNVQIMEQKLSKH